MKEKTRKLLHSRTVFSQGFLRKDGLIDIVGSIKDTKSYDIPKSNGTILNVDNGKITKVKTPSSR